MRKERHERHSAYPPFPHLVLRGREEAEAELLQRCGRFLSPASSEQRLRSVIVSNLAKVDLLDGQPLFAGPGIPLNWQLLLNYLHEQKVILQPAFGMYGAMNDRPKLFNFELRFNQSGRKSDGNMLDGAGYGGAFTRDIAMSKAVGETLERYFLTIYREKDFIRKTAAQVEKHFMHSLDIDTLNGFLPWQKKVFPQFVTDKNTPLYWVKGEEFMTGRNALIPAQLVFWNYRHKDAEGNGKEYVLSHITTSGCAGHFSKDEAVLSGLLENIQRDGFLLYWLNMLSPKIVDVTVHDDPEVREFLTYMDRYRLKLIFLNTTTDVGIPSMTCVAMDETTGEPCISIGASAGFDLKNMIIQSGIEALLLNDHIAKNDRYELGKEYRPFSDIRIGRPERLKMWKGKDMLEKLSFFITGEKQSPKDFIAGMEQFTQASTQLEYVLKRFKEMGKGYEVYVYEAQDPVLKTLGYHVVRTIVPQLIPLYLREHAPSLHSKRLKNVPEKLGYKAATQLNPWPHPFP